MLRRTDGPGPLTRLALLVGLGFVLSLSAAQGARVTLHLKNGDRLTGDLLSEDDTRIVLTTPWNAALPIPKSEIKEKVAAPSVEALAQEKARALEVAIREATAHTPSSQPAPNPKPASKAPANDGAATAKLERSTQAKRLDKWKWNLRVGADFIQGAKNRRIYTGQTSITYTRNYKHAPRQFLRNKLEYHVDYGETDDQVSANRMIAANKLDLDVGAGFYGYTSVGGGYDEVRKIEYQCEAGPGLGYHILAKKVLAIDTEIGLNYQFREGLDNAPNRELIQGRLGQELTWEVMPKITLTERVAFLPFMDQFGEYQVRLEGNLGFGIVQHLSLNFTVRNFYDTQPAPGVPNNEFQFRSSVGVTF